MKVILLKDVKGKGKKNDIIDVSDGYANNFLIKNNFGIKYTEGSKKVLDKELDEAKEKENNLINDLSKIKDKLNNKNILFKVKVGKQDKVFGNVSTKQICEEIKKMGINIDKKCIKASNNIDQLGTHKVLIELHKKVSFYINVILEKSE